MNKITKILILEINPETLEIESTDAQPNTVFAFELANIKGRLEGLKEARNLLFKGGNLNDAIFKLEQQLLIMQNP